MVRFFDKVKEFKERLKTKKRLRQAITITKLKKTAEKLEAAKRIRDQIQEQKARIEKAKGPTRQERLEQSSKQIIERENRIAKVRQAQLKRERLEARIIKSKRKTIEAKGNRRRVEVQIARQQLGQPRINVGASLMDFSSRPKQKKQVPQKRFRLL